MVNLPGALLMLAIALVIGALAAWPASRRGDNRVGVAVSGAAGPLLVALAYFLAAPAVGEQDQQLSAFVIAPYAVLAGLAGSVIVSAIGPRGSRAQARAARKAAASERDARAASDIADWTQALADADAAEARRRAETGEQADGDDPWAAAPDRSAEPVTIGARQQAPAGAVTTSKASAPTGKASVTGHQGKRRPKPSASAKSADLDSAKDLESDAYAPARAYGGSESSGRTYTSESANRAYAEDTVTDEADAQPVEAVRGARLGRAALAVGHRGGEPDRARQARSGPRPWPGSRQVRRVASPGGPGRSPGTRIGPVLRQRSGRRPLRPGQIGQVWTGSLACRPTL